MFYHRFSANYYQATMIIKILEPRINNLK